MEEDVFLGKGWSFPPSFDLKDQSVRMVSGKDDIDQSLHILLSTTIGERIMQPRYGCNLIDFLFEPLNTSMKAYIRKIVEDAILYFEPRIRLNEINLTADGGKLDIGVDYTIKTSNSRSNFVFPFYFEDGKTP